MLDNVVPLFRRYITNLFENAGTFFYPVPPNENRKFNSWEDFGYLIY